MQRNKPISAGGSAAPATRLMTVGDPAPDNLLLATLPAAERRRVLADSKQVELIAGETLNEPGERIRHVFFPTSGFISLIMPMDRRAQLEVGLVGNEGMLGVSLILGVPTSPVRALVQGSGSAWRMDVAAFGQALGRGPALERGLGRYLYVLISQIAQTAACGRFHQVEARLARWLLMTRDRAHSNRFNITQELLAYMLGVRREGVTVAAGILRRQKVIRYSRGDVEILDVDRLEATACACYTSAKEMYARILCAA
jgi:CRP-like cAMP-binding protein